jgi:NAD(P)H-flavin reductase
MTALFKQAQQSADSQLADSTLARPAKIGHRTDLSSNDAEETHSTAYCLPSGQMRPAAGLFMKQGVQAVCCTYHAQAKAQPKGSEEFARWTLTSITPVSRHSAVYHFTSTDSARGTPYTRGRGRTIWHKTWHTTLRTADGIERDYTPTCTWEQWQSGECDLLVGVRPSEAAAAWLHKQPLGSDVWLSKPKMTLPVPSLVHPNHSIGNHPDALAHAGILLVLGGAGGIPAAVQVLQHTDATTCFGTGADRVPPLTSPVHLVYACERDDVLMTSELARWCAPGGATLRRLVLAISTPPEQAGAVAFPQMEAEDVLGLNVLETLDNVSILQGGSPLTGELLQAEMAPLRVLGRCRVVVSGPASFNVAVTKMLEAQCRVDPNAITIVETGESADSMVQEEEVLEL